MLERTGSVEVDARYTIVDELLDEFRTAHARVGEREEETIADRFTDIIWIGDSEAIGAEYLLHLLGTDGIFPGVLNEVDLALTAESQHLGIAILRGGCATRSDHVLDAGDEGRTKHARIMITLGKGREMTVEELVGDAHQCYALTCIREDL